MDLVKTIQEAVKSKKAIIGYKEAIKYIKLNKPKLIVVANNTPESMKKDIEYNAKIFGLKVEIINISSKELGVICGKPYPVTTIVIK